MIGWKDRGCDKEKEESEGKKSGKENIKDRSGKKRKNKVQYQKTFIISSWIDGCKWWTVKEGKQQCKDKEKRKSRNMRGLWAGGKTRQTVTWTRFESKIKWLKELKKKLETKESNQN